MKELIEELNTNNIDFTITVYEPSPEGEYHRDAALREKSYRICDKRFFLRKIYDDCVLLAIETSGSSYNCVVIPYKQIHKLEFSTPENQIF